MTNEERSTALETNISSLTAQLGTLSSRIIGVKD